MKESIFKTNGYHARKEISPRFKWKTFELPVLSTITVDTTVPQTPVPVQCRMDRVALAKIGLRVWNRAPRVESREPTNITGTTDTRSVMGVMPRFVPSVLTEHGIHVQCFKPSSGNPPFPWNGN